MIQINAEAIEEMLKWHTAHTRDDNGVIILPRAVGLIRHMEQFVPDADSGVSISGQLAHELIKAGRAYNKLCDDFDSGRAGGDRSLALLNHSAAIGEFVARIADNHDRAIKTEPEPEQHESIRTSSVRTD